MNFIISKSSSRGLKGRPRRGKASLHIGRDRRHVLTFFFLLFTSLLSPALVLATPQVPRTIVFQGILTDDGGNPLTDVSSAEASISIVDGAATVRYEELQTITLYQGATAFLVGMGVSPDTGEPTGGIPLDMVEPGEGDLILKIKLAGQSIAQENIILASVPFSFYSQYATALTQPIGSDQIKDGTITIEDISEEALNTIKEGELTKEDLEAHKTEKSAHAATSISVDNTFRYLTGTNLQTLLESTDYTLTLAIKAAQTIDSGDIQDGSVGLNDLDMSQFSGWDTNASDDLTITTTFGGALTGAYNNLELADNTVHSSTIVDGSIESIDLADGSVTASKLAESYLLTTGGTLTGNLNMENSDITLSDGRTVDGADVSELKEEVDDHETRVTTLENNKLCFVQRYSETVTGTDDVPGYRGDCYVYGFATSVPNPLVSFVTMAIYENGYYIDDDQNNTAGYLYTAKNKAIALLYNYNDTTVSIQQLAVGQTSSSSDSCPTTYDSTKQPLTLVKKIPLTGDREDLQNCAYNSSRDDADIEAVFP